MAQQNTQQEPTMEEILASIRRIISEDADEGQKAPEPQPAVQAKAAPRVAAPEPEEDILDLQEVVEEEPVAVRAPEPEPMPAPIARPKLQPKPKPVVQEEEDVMLVDRDPDSERGEGLVSHTAGAAVASAFGQLATRTRVADDPTVTIEDMVRDMLKPLLKDWLEDNLPRVVERLVQEEIERVQRQTSAPPRRR